MWKNGELKAHARHALRKNYWTLILIFFILIFVGGMNTMSAKNVVYTAPDGISSGIMSYLSSEEAAISDDATGAEDASSASNEDAANNSSSSDGSGDSTADSNNKSGLGEYLDNIHDNPKVAAKIAQRTLDKFNGTGGFLYSIMYQVDKFIFSHSALAKFISIAAVVLYLPFYIFIWNGLYLGYQRVLIESQTYSKTRFRRIFSIFHMKGYVNACLVLLRRTIFLILLGILAFLPIAFLAAMSYGDISFGNYLDAIIAIAGMALFIVLTFITLRQYFSLILVPYILASEPRMKRKEAFKLSRKMMHGNIMHYIGFRLSFIGWHILEVLSFGILRVFFSGSYILLAQACLYLKLREHALEADFEEAQKIKGPLLTNPPQSALEGISPESIVADKSGFKIYPLEYPDMQPSRLNKIAKFMEGYEPTRHYSFVNIIMLFFIFSMLGWCWEVMLHIIRDGVLVNRGTLQGPWLPIYGVGGVLIILFLRRFADKPYVLFPITMLLCGVLEFSTSWYLETFMGQRWWDYSNYFMNLNGRICLEGLLTFAVGGLLFIYLLGPVLDNFLKKMNGKIKIVCACVLLVIFAIDVAYSSHHPNMGAGITDYGQSGQAQISQSQSASGSSGNGASG